MFQRLKGYRTVLFHAAVGIPAVVLATLDYLKTFDFSQFFNSKTALLVLAGVNIAGIWLRFITDTRVGDSR